MLVFHIKYLNIWHKISARNQNYKMATRSRVYVNGEEIVELLDDLESEFNDLSADNSSYVESKHFFYFIAIFYNRNYRFIYLYIFVSCHK